MANIIDALVVTLGLDAAKFKKGAKETDEALDKTSKNTNKVSKDMEAWGKNAAVSIGKLRNEVLGLLAVFTAGVGIKNFVENTINSTASLGRMSANLNMSAKDLAEWQLANKNAGGTVEGMTAQLKEAAGEVAKFKMGQSSDSAQWFYRMGGDPAALKDGNTYLLARAKIIADLYKKDPTRAQFVAAQMGISEDTFNLIKQGPAAIERLRMAQARLADEQAKASVPMEAFRKKLDTLKNNFEAIGVKILTSLMPQFDRFANWIASHQNDIETWANRAVDAVAAFVKWADAAAQSVGGWKVVLEGLIGLKILSIVSPLVSLGAALVNIGVALGTIGGVAGTSALAVIAKLAARLGVGAALLFHSEGLNQGEDAELARRRRGGGGRSASGRLDDSSGMFAQLEKKYGLPAGVLDSMWAQESGRGKHMLSPAGAKGHFGFMDGTAKQYGVTNPNDLAQSADGAARMLRDLMRQNGGNLQLALAAYNWGQGNLNRKGLGNAPMETLNYMRQVPERMARNGGSTSTSETNINGPINIVTQATDAPGIAKGIGQGLKEVAFASQANTGLQ